MTDPHQIIPIHPETEAMEPLELDPAGFRSPLPGQHYHGVFEGCGIELAISIRDTTPMQEASGPNPGEQFITALKGSLVIPDAARDAPRAAVTGLAGQSTTFRDGSPDSWIQEYYRGAGCSRALLAGISMPHVTVMV